MKRRARARKSKKQKNAYGASSSSYPSSGDLEKSGSATATASACDHETAYAYGHDRAYDSQNQKANVKIRGPSASEHQIGRAETGLVPRREGHANREAPESSPGATVLGLQDWRQLA